MEEKTVFDIWDPEGDWDDLKTLCGGLLNRQSEKILRECLEGAARGMIVEKEYIDKDYRNSYSGFYSQKFSRLSSRAVRLHFFQVRVTEEDLDSAEFLTLLEERARTRSPC